MWTGTYNSTYGAWNENDSSALTFRNHYLLLIRV